MFVERIERERIGDRTVDCEISPSGFGCDLHNELRAEYMQLPLMRKVHILDVKRLMILGATAFLACLSIEWLNTSYQVAYCTAAFAATAVFVSLIVEWRRGSFSWLAIYVGALVLHPAWRLSYEEVFHGWRAASSDCGYGNRFFSVALLLTTAAVMVLVLCRSTISRRLFLLVLASGCWLIYIGNLLFWRIDLFRSEIPLAFSASTFVQELIMAVDFAQTRLIRYAFCLTVICAALYTMEWKAKKVAK